MGLMDLYKCLDLDIEPFLPEQHALEIHSYILIFINPKQIFGFLMSREYSSVLNRSYVATIWNFDPNYSLPNVIQFSLPKKFQIVKHGFNSALKSMFFGPDVWYRIGS